MNTLFKTLSFACLTSMVLIVSSCANEDPGPLQASEKEFSVIDFDRLEMGSGFEIDVKQSSTYRINVEGDHRNINDLVVFKSGSTLIIKYKDNANRNHETKISIEMPELRGVNFTGASESKVRDFESDQEFELNLSGSSVCQLVAGYRSVKGVISGASSVLMEGLGDEVNVDISGASSLVAFDYPVRAAKLKVSGASHAKVTATDELNVTAAGGSALLYRGSPILNFSVSGASTVEKD
ncbi:MAG: head GIN domain-containing protein [Chryseolinea sp.]